MLFAPPPGYSPTSINRQTIGMMGSPGVQGRSILDRDPAASSYILPSSSTVPSSQMLPGTNPMGAQNMSNVLRSLQGVAR